ncbi:MAG: glycosyltransferase [Oscillospiraceae bacterium]
MRIAMVTALHPHDDVRIYHKEALTLAHAGHHVEIWNPRYEGVGESGILFCKLLLPPGRTQRLWREGNVIMSLLRERSVQVCHLHDPELLTLILRLQRADVMVVYDAHEDLPRSISTKNWIFTPLRPAASKYACWLLDRKARMTNGIIAATKSIAATLPNSVLVRNRVTGSDCARFWCASQNESPQPMTVCYAGAITERRGIFEMTRACASIGATLLLAGEFESEALYRKLFAMPESDAVCYKGCLNRDKLALFYAQSQAGLLLLGDTPSYRSSEPVKLFEYLCAGLPVIAWDYPIWRDLVGDAAVHFVPPGDVSAASAAIKQILLDPSMWASAMRQREACFVRFGFADDAERLLTLYNRLEECSHQHHAH